MSADRDPDYPPDKAILEDITERWTSGETPDLQALVTQSLLLAHKRIMGWEFMRSERHRARKLCPHCGDDLMRAGIMSLVYTHEVCSCGEPDYDHLVEQLWHRVCFLEAGTP